MMHRRVVPINFAVVAFAIAAAVPTAAQANRTPVQLAAGNDVGGGLVRVTIDSPIYVQPDSNREPLRIAKEGSVLRMIRTEGAFTYVEFADPDYPRRYGYIQSRFVEQLAPPRPEPLDLSVPEARQGVPTPLPRPAAAPTTTQAARDPSLVQQPPPAPVVPEQTRTFTPKSTPRRGWLDIDAVRFQSVDREALTLTRTGLLYGEVAAVATSYPAQTIGINDVGVAGGFGFPHGIGFSLHFDGENYSGPAGLAISIPSPYFLNTSATDARPTTSTLERRERALDIGAEYVMPAPDWLRLRVFGGPTVFYVSNEMVSDIQYNQVASSLIRINVVAINTFTKNEVTAWSVGFHVGTDAALFFSRHVGLGGGVRFNRGTVTVHDTLSNQDAGLRVGHLAFNGGLRLRF
ncbi:MAG: hypothetical protein ABJA98_26275 [Acidobacteriota bacterium]